MRRTLATVLIAILSAAGLAEAASPTRKAAPKTFTAVGHSIEGAAANGSKSRKGTVAADPSVLPLGSRIRVRGAGAYSGEYTVIDSGVKGHVIDIYMASGAEALKFGRKKVNVEILTSPRSARD